MNKRVIWISSAIAVAITIVASLLAFRDDSVAPSRPLAVGLQPTPTNAAPSNTSQRVLPPVVAVPAQYPALSVAADDATSEALDKMFVVDSKGDLSLTPTTLLNVEKLYALNTPIELQNKMQELAQFLPPAAYRQLADVMDRYKNYSNAAKQTYPPGAAPATEEEALAQLDGLHALREAHFGATSAHAFFADEEKLNRQLLDLMRLEKDQSLTMEEKAANAQQLIQSKPELASAYAPDRR